jgi:outer membrane receptor protein involved in Fe transport
MIHTTRYLAVAALLAAAAGRLPAQTTTSTTTTATTTDASGQPVQTMAAFNVQDVPLEDQIMPTTRPISGVLGDDTEILDIPRSVTTIDKSLLTQRQVKQMTDLGQFSPGVYTPAQYGLPATPVIRGDEGSVYLNGQRGIFSFNSVVPSFNGVDAIDIVKGPGSAVYGPQAQGTGGYINLVTKQPYFDGDHSQITVTLGSWVEGGQSNWNPEWQLDTGGPISPKLAYRFSYLGRAGDGFYKGSKNESEDFYGALTYLFSSKLKLEWFGQAYSDRYNEISGVNRVTQNFINNGTYIGGSVQPLNVFGQTVADGPYFLLLDPATAHDVKLPADIALISPSDNARAKRLVTQLVTTLTITPDANIQNLTMFEDQKSRKQETYGYDELVPTDWAIDNRTELHWDLHEGNFKDKSITGVDLRYQRLVGYSDYTNEPFFLYDLSKPISQIDYPGYNPSSPTANFGGNPIPGYPGYAGFGLGPDATNQDSFLYQAGVFTQHNFSFGSNWSAVLGLRADYIRGDARSSNMVGAPLGYFYNSHGHNVDPSIFGSLVYKLTDKISAYATVDSVDAVIGGGNFGGVDGTGGDAGLKEALKTASLLYEAGLKASFLDNKLYTSAAVYDQKRTQPELRAPSSLIRSNGVELEAVYQPNKYFNINANATFQHVEREGNNFYEQTGNYLDGYPVGFIVDGKSGTGAGSPNYYTNPAYQTIEESGLPKYIVNIFAVYQLDSGWGIGAGPQFQGGMNADQEGALTIPAQYDVDAFVFYKQKTWDIQVSVKNVTNQRNLTPIDPNFAGNDQIYVVEPINTSVTIRYRF